MNSNARDIAVVLVPFIVLSAYGISSFSFAIDEYTYMNTARGILHGEQFDVPTLSRFPLFSASLYALYAVAGPSEAASKMLSVLFGAATVVAVYFLSSRMFGRDVAFLASLLLSTNPFMVFFSSKVLTEAEFMLLLVGCAYAIYKSAQNPRFLVLFGALLGALILTRYTGAFMLLVMVFYLWRAKKLRSLLSVWGVIGASALLLVLVPWLYLSWSATGSPLGLFLYFFESQIQTGPVAMSLPDRIPSYILLLPFVAGAAFPLFVSSLPKLRKETKNNGLSLLFIIIILYTLLMELNGFLHPRLLRYIAVMAPFLSVIVAWHAQSRYRRSGILKAVVAANVLLAVTLLAWSSGYAKHVDYRVAGLYTEENCKGDIATNIQPVIYHYTSRQPVALSGGVSCVVVSGYEHTDPTLANLPETYRKVFEHGMVSVYKSGS